jgi:hypothetical protein
MEKTYLVECYWPDVTTDAEAVVERARSADELTTG